jgi:hypothetical protein
MVVDVFVGDKTGFIQAGQVATLDFVWPIGCQTLCTCHLAKLEAMQL